MSSGLIKDLILVTGSNGFLGSHIVDQLLKDHYKVRAVVRNLKIEEKIKHLRQLGKNSRYPLEIVEADLLDPLSWKKVMNDVSVVIHVAMPLPLETPKEENVLLRPAIEGTLNVLRASHEALVKRVVLTSSCVAITGPTYKDFKIYNEHDWGDASTKFTYCKSKIKAEKAAWDFIAEKKMLNERTIELVVINPSLMLGPLLHNSLGPSSQRFLSLLNGSLSKIPHLYSPTCDVRDVARAHVIAAFLPEAKSKRFLIASEASFISMSRWAIVLEKEFLHRGYRIPSEVDIVDYNCKAKTCRLDLSQMRMILKLKPRPFKQTIIDMAYSLIEKKFI